MPGPPINVVYRPKTDAEGERRWKRMESLVGTPFERLPGEPPQHKVIGRTSDGIPIRVQDVEMVFNDAALMDQISDYGTDGPLYRDTIKETQREVYELAIKLYGRDPSVRPS